MKKAAGSHSVATEVDASSHTPGESRRGMRFPLVSAWQPMPEMNGATA